MFGLRYTAITLASREAGGGEGKVEHVHPLHAGRIRSNYLAQTRKTENSIYTRSTSGEPSAQLQPAVLTRVIVSKLRQPDSRRDFCNKDTAAL